MTNHIKNRVVSLPPAIWIILFLIAVLGTQVTGFFSLSNLQTFLITAAPLLVLSCGQTLVFMTQGTDLSVGSIVSMTSVLWILLMKLGVLPFAAIILALLGGMLAGFINGLIVSKLHIPAFITTLGTQNIFASLALVLSNSETIYIQSDLFYSIIYGEFLFIPISVWIAACCFFITFLVLKRTQFGIRIVALGGNREALNLAGISADSNMIKAFSYAGLMAGVAGVLMACRIGSGNPLAGEGMEFNSIAAVLLGGTSMREAYGTVVGTVLGVVLIQLVKTGLNQVGIDSIYQNATIGSIVLLAIIVDAVVKRIRD